MKTLFLLMLIFFGLLACGPSPLPERYLVQLPPSPAFQTEVLGESQWRLEWYDSGGTLQRAEIDGKSAEISVLVEWPSAILAWPYWPEKGLAAGLFYPAGAIVPFDVAGDTISLSWEAGPEAYFFRELDNAQFLNTSNRKPEYFDWKRFRGILREETPDNLKKDPWLADWKTIAEKTARGGFRKTYLKAEPRTSAEITIPHNGPWLGLSLFRQAEFWEEGETISLSFGSRPEIFVCPGGMLSVSPKARLWTLFP